MSEVMRCDRVDTPLCYCTVYEQYLKKNQPFLLTKYFTQSWISRKEWVTDEGKPNWKYLQEHYGQSEVPVANCDETYYNSHAKTSWILTDYLSYLIKYKESGYSSSMPCLYLKDWHFMQNLKVEPVYETPSYFAVDWLNEYWITKEKDDYRFVYIGPKGSWTPFHSDVYGSFSWSANITGKKRWIMLPPGEEAKLKLLSPGNFPPNDLSKIDLTSSDVQFIDLIQNEGEIVFVPSGWFHQVWNLEDTISINHNWFNGANVHRVFTALVRASGDIQTELKEYAVTDVGREQLETILKSHHGMNFSGLEQLLQTVKERREREFLRIHPSSTDTKCSCIDGQATMCDEEYHRTADRQTALDVLNIICNTGEFSHCK